MPLLYAAGRPPQTPRRVLVAGTSGAGKTTVAAVLARSWGLPRTELDALYHGPGWVPREAFLGEVQALAASPSWVVEWQYDLARPVLAAHADLLVWLDLPRRVVVWRLVLRTVRRRVARAELWHGNREPPLRTVLSDPEHVVRWAWRSHPLTARQVLALTRSRPELPVVRLRSAGEVRRWLAGSG